jgi:HAD superfamily hydrolase (TIGR01509 family)
MGGVLADSEPLHQQVIRALLAEYGVDWSPDGHDPTVGMRSLESFALICSVHALPHDPRDLDARYTERVVPVLRERVVPMPGVPDVPRALAARGLRLAVASSSGPAVIDATLTALGVRPLFEAIVSGVEVARGKPAPDVFLEAARRLGLLPERVAAIEDSANGIRAGRAAGMRTIAIPNRRYPPPADALAQADLVLDDLESLTAEAVSG